MNKTRFLFLLISIVFFSCAKKKDNLQRKTTGKINIISVIIDDQLWNGEIGDSIRNKFASPVIGLPQEEPLFTINQYPVKLMEGFMTDSRTIIVVKKEDKNKFEIKKDQYASPQTVFHISGKSGAEILKIIEKNTPKIIQIIKETEITENQRIINQSLLNTNAISMDFHASFKVPSGYSYVIKKNKFIWLKKEIVSGNTSLLIYQVPIASIKKDSNLIANIIKMRDSVGELYIRGTELDTKMITEEGYAPYFSKIELDGKESYETKGTWVLKNDFMSGPFINYSIVDEEHNRILVLEGFCYSPSREERDLMHELESIIKSIKILK
ncbi:DUF4837 family protein [uncultured Flavobacterium sp.]|uniref:DUF4837 family protein n=1 Tax=uncultured Flavobacterium sp. TaxID=165435 RepID=UPI0030CA1C9F